VSNRRLRSKQYRGVLLDPKFRYVPAAQTDVRATWERERRRLAAEAAARAGNDAEIEAKVRPIVRRAKP
jgi:hypothetical protein